MKHRPHIGLNPQKPTQWFLPIFPRAQSWVGPHGGLCFPSIATLSQFELLSRFPSLSNLDIFVSSKVWTLGAGKGRFAPIHHTLFKIDDIYRQPLPFPCCTLDSQNSKPKSWCLFTFFFLFHAFLEAMYTLLMRVYSNMGKSHGLIFHSSLPLASLTPIHTCYRIWSYNSTDR